MLEQATYIAAPKTRHRVPSAFAVLWTLRRRIRRASSLFAAALDIAADEMVIVSCEDINPSLLKPATADVVKNV